MRQQTDTYTRHVVLPSGRTIEIVYLDGRASAVGAPRSLPSGDVTMAEIAHDLMTCGSCACDFVQPVDWDEAGSKHWRVTLRCPNCEQVGTIVVEDEVVDHYDIALERGAAELARTLHVLVEQNIEEEALRMRAALDGGHVLPEDF